MSFFPQLDLGSRKVLVSVAAVAFAAGVWIFPACSSPTDGQESAGGSGDVLATIGDEAIERSAVEEKAKEGLEQAEAQKLQCELNFQRSRHQVMESTIQTMVRDRLLELEAESRGISKEELLTQEVTNKLPAVSDEDVDKFYTENQARIRQPKEQVAAQIRQYLEGQGREGTYNSFIEGLEAEHDVSYELGPYRVEVAKGDAEPKGPDSAPIQIVEFSDFECPFCSRVVPTIDQVVETYGDKVQVSFRHFPLPMHPGAQKAAEASMCADDQGKFWAMHDLMFQEQKQLAVDQLKEKAARLELDTEAFNQCLDSDKYAAQVKADTKAGSMVGVSGTPAVFINGRFLSGAQPYESFAEIIDDELEKAGVAN